MCIYPAYEQKPIKPEYEQKPIKPEYKLADMMTRDLAVKIDPNLLRLFLQLHWTKITKLAHDIHDQL
jgi:hypothetical protein